MKTTKNKQILGIMLAYSLAMLVMAVLLGNFADSLRGFWTILRTPAQLTIDYFKLGTAGGAFLNAGLVGLSCLLVIWLSRADLNSISLMAFLLTLGFGFFGINFLNMWPCILGTWLFTRVAKVPFSSHVNVALFSTGLAPFVSEAMFRYPLFGELLIAKILFGIVVGLFIGFLMALVCQHGPNLHKGYSLYNGAVGAGFIGILLLALLFRATGVEIPTNTDIGDAYPRLVNTFMIVLSVLAIVAGFVMNGFSFKGYSKVLKSTGYRCDLTALVGVPITLTNIGVFGLLGAAYYNLVGAPMNGVTAGCMICLLAVAPCGAHVLNMVPIMLGYALASTFCVFDLNTQAIIVGLCFSAALSPVAGRFGSLCGILAGLIHACLVTTVVTFHGGFCLYNGGFTCTVTSILLIPGLEYFFQPSDRLSLLPKRKKLSVQNKA